MKTTIYHNKSGFIMIEYIISLLFVYIFLSLSYVLLKNVNNTKENISNSVNITENIKIIDSIVYKIRKSSKINIDENTIESDDFKIKNINNELFVYSNNMIQKDYLFKAKDIKFLKKNNLIYLKFEFRYKNRKINIVRIINDKGKIWKY